MRSEGRGTTGLAVGLAAILLLWPAFWNGYPLVFSDTGTYLSQAVEHYVGWDRPIFYSLFLFPLHMTLTTWPAIAAQALLLTYLLHLVRRSLLPGTSVWWLLPITAGLAVASPLPWFGSQLMPDVFTGIVVLTLALLIFAGDHLSTGERICLVALAALAIVVHQSHVLLAAALLLVLPRLRQSRLSVAWSITPLIVAVIALTSVNLLAFGRASLSPFGNVFLLTRIIYDGPGVDALHRNCPAAGWRLCPFIGSLPAIADDFLWRADGPVARAGGAKEISRDADAIITAALASEPGTELRAFVRNSARQLARFATGDGLQQWPETVAPRIARHFPAFETAAFSDSRQSAGALTVPPWLKTLHAVAGLAGIAGCCVLLLAAPRRHVATLCAAAVLVALVANAAIAGGLSGPHDRYQSRVMWLPPLVAVLGVLSVRRAVIPALS
jgi:hypothetical protein